MFSLTILCDRARWRTIRCQSTPLAGRCGGRIQPAFSVKNLWERSMEIKFWLHEIPIRSFFVGWFFWMIQKTDGISLSFTYPSCIKLLWFSFVCSCFVCFTWIFKCFLRSPGARMKLIESSATLALSWSRSRARGSGTDRQSMPSKT